MRFGSSVLALTAAFLAAGTTPAQDRKPLTFGTSTEMVNVVISVTDKKGKPIGDLKQENFTILEDFVPQEVSLFERLAPNMDLVVMIDASGSMGNRMDAGGDRLIDTAKKAAKKFVQSLRPGDRAMVVDFAASAWRHVNPDDPFTSDIKLLEAAIEGLDVRKRAEIVRNRATGEEFEQMTVEPTSLYTSLYVVLREFVDKRSQPDPEHPRRAVVVMLTDGEDNTSMVSAEQVTEQARTSGTPIYSIMIPSRAVGYDAEKKAEDAEYFLRTLAKDSGGSIEKLKLMIDLPAAYAKISRDLQTQYRIGYQPKNTKPTPTGWHSIDVSVSGKAELTVRHRLGYYAQGFPKAP